MDTVDIIAYRTEMDMAQIVQQEMVRHDNTRSLMRGVDSAEVDILAAVHAKTLIIGFHPLANQSSDPAVRQLCDQLNATATLFPGTDLRLPNELVSPQCP